MYSLLHTSFLTLIFTTTIGSMQIQEHFASSAAGGIVAIIIFMLWIIAFYRAYIVDWA